MMAAAAEAARNAGGASQQRSGGAPGARPGGGMGGFQDPSSKNVKEFVTGLIKHEYLNGYKLPDMPL
jgi:hypothetical protein